MQRIEINVVTGEKTIIPYTPEEEAAYQVALAADLVAAPARAKAALATEPQAALLKIDAASVRSIREFLLAKFPADSLMPNNANGVPVLPPLDAEAGIERARLK